MSQIEVQDIFRMHGATYLENNPLPGYIQKVMRAISDCRTAKLGGHIDCCEDCHYTHISYNSCRNRHCPKCQALAKERWIMARKEELLPVSYFHVVFTLPSELDVVVMQNQKVMYNLLFKAASETIRELAKDKKYLGAEIGLTAILHTWGQNLSFHPHIHMIVPGGGITESGEWRNSRKKFFIPVKVLSKKFRGKFLHYLKEEELLFKGGIRQLKDALQFQTLLTELYKKDWYVYCKRPFKTANSVLEYLGRYTHRVAISNQRIISCINGQVTFKWRDYKDGKKEKVMVLPAEEFMRRYLLHILPQQFTKIRHYGFLSSATKKKKLELCKKLTGAKQTLNNLKEKLSTEQLIKKITGVDINTCPKCGCSLSRAAPEEEIK